MVNAVWIIVLQLQQAVLLDEVLVMMTAIVSPWDQLLLIRLDLRTPWWFLNGTGSIRPQVNSCFESRLTRCYRVALDRMIFDIFRNF